MKKIITILLLVTGIGFVASFGYTADAQLFTYTGTSTAPSSSVITPSTSATSTNSNTSSNSSIGTTGTSLPTSLPTTITPSTSNGWIQFNGLVVQTVSSNIAPAEIAALGPNETTSGASAVCEFFVSEDSTLGTATSCPIPTTAGVSGTTAIAPYRIEVNAATTVLLRDRTKGVLANITPGDEINVFGSYTSDGVIQASVVRDLSKPQVGIIPATGITPLLSGLSANPALANLSATITQVNADGSFVVQLNNGQTLTLNNPIRVGLTVTYPEIVTIVQNLINQLQSSSTISTSTASGTSVPMIPYVPSSTATSSTATSGTPSIY